MENSRYKFRAWDDSEKEMLSWGQLINDPDNWIIELLRGESHKEDVLMQYTGLKDKNGKEIWEGDIVKIRIIVHPQYPPVIYPRAIVRWDKNNAGFNARSDYEIIGNIYEDPQLLDEKSMSKEEYLLSDRI